MNIHRFHVISLPHLATNKKNSPCAYTQKVRLFCQMMKSLGHVVYFYGPEGSEVECDDFAQIISTKEQEQLYGVHPTESMYPLEWKAELPIWVVTNRNAVVEIHKRKQPKDFICIIGGNCQQYIAENVGPDVFVVEYGIGYEGVFSQFRVFESYSHRSQIMGLNRQYNSMSFYDAVIPNYYDVNDFPYPHERENYCLYIGRLTKMKGVEIAVAATEAVRIPLLIAGQGITEKHTTKIITKDFTIDKPHVKYIGVLGYEERAKVMGAAKAVLVPTVYNGPFEGVAAESALTGSPVVSSDFGNFNETVEHGKTGFRCNNLRQFVEALKRGDNLHRNYIRQRAISLWSIDRVKWMYQEYFDHIVAGVGTGWGRLDLPCSLDCLAPMPSQSDQQTAQDEPRHAIPSFPILGQDNTRIGA